MKVLVIAVILLHVLSVAWVLGIRLCVNSDEDLVSIDVRIFFIPILKKRISLSALFPPKADGSQIAADGEKAVRKVKNKKMPSGIVLAIAENIVKRIVAHKFDISGKLGFSDAGMTAYTVGIIGIVYTQICSFLCYDRVGDCGIKPEYDREEANLMLDGIFSISFADIIVAAVTAVGSTIKRRGTLKRSDRGKYITE